MIQVLVKVSIKFWMANKSDAITNLSADGL